MKRRTIRRVLCGAAAAGIALVGTTTVAEAAGPAPQEPSHFRTTVYGADADTVLAGLTLEVFTDPGGVDIAAALGCTLDTKVPFDRSPVLASRGESCQLPVGDYAVGVDGVPTGYDAVGFCYTNSPNPEIIPGDTTFTVSFDQSGVCEVYVGPADATMLYTINMNGLGHETALTGVDIEVYEGGALVDPLDCTSSGPDVHSPMYGGPFTAISGSCNLPPSGINDNLVELAPQTGYELGITPLPEGYSVRYAECYPFFLGPDERLTDPTVGFEIFPTQQGTPSTLCEIYLDGPPTVYVEHVVNGGPADTTDFTTQLFDDSGAQAGESSDPAPEFCTPGELDGGRLVEATPSGAVTDVCGAIVAPEGSYTVGALLPDYGYEATADCAGEPPFGQGETERIVSDLTDFSHPTSRVGSSLCVLTADYYEQTISVDVVVDNTAGGDSDGSDITVEVYDQDGTLVDSGVDPAPNDPAQSAEFTLPIGDYTIGVSGPDGYVYSVTVTVVDNDITAPDPVEIIDDGSADLSTTSTETASVELLATGQPAPTTTTTTTTTVAPTTAAPTTAAPTTAAPTTAAPTTPAPTTTAVGAGGILPVTGGTSTTTMLAWWALGLLVAGALIARMSRRPSNSQS